MMTEAARLQLGRLSGLRDAGCGGILDRREQHLGFGARGIADSSPSGFPEGTSCADGECQEPWSTVETDATFSVPSARSLAANCMRHSAR